MNARVEALLEQAKTLTPEERLTLLDALGELISPPDTAWTEAWAKESEDRLKAYEQGRMEAEDFEVAMDKLRKDYLQQ